MAAEDIAFYRSENGDQTVLVGGMVGSTVRHELNAASGGRTATFPWEISCRGNSTRPRAPLSDNCWMRTGEVRRR